MVFSDCNVILYLEGLQTVALIIGFYKIKIIHSFILHAITCRVKQKNNAGPSMMDINKGGPISPLRFLNENLTTLYRLIDRFAD